MASATLFAFILWGLSLLLWDFDRGCEEYVDDGLRYERECVVYQAELSAYLEGEEAEAATPGIPRGRQLTPGLQKVPFDGLQPQEQRSERGEYV